MRDIGTVESQTRDREWAKTDIGKLFYALDRALGVAWREDTILGERDGSDRAAKAAWEREGIARAAFLKELRGW